uniref:helix-turn-helix domain-containing protein n=1 Tax=Megasphaera stantonii TaxID=2144175 RepID=UPI0018E50358
MDHIHSNTIEDVRTPGRHLSLEERGMIQALHRQGLSLRNIAAAVGCAHTTVFYELRRGTPDRKSKHGRAPQYMAKRGQKAYAENRKNSRKPCKIDHDDCEQFIQWMVERVRQERGSQDACVGHARRNKLFTPQQTPCTKTPYNMLWANRLPLSLFEVPPVLKHKPLPTWVRTNQR